MSETKRCPSENEPNEEGRLMISVKCCTTGGTETELEEEKLGREGQAKEFCNEWAKTNGINRSEN